MADPDVWYKDKGGLEGAYEAGKKHAEAEREKMRVADVKDRWRERRRGRRRERGRNEKKRFHLLLCPFLIPSHS
jgi:ATP-dependent RNA helicase DDX10/DBP4